MIILFGTLGFFGLRTALRAADHYQALVAGTLTATVVSQAFINIGYVVGVLPVTGIQLPLISAGGTSAIITLAAMGILANIARHEPAAVSAMQSYGRPVFDRLLFIGEPDTPAVRRDGSRRPRRTRGEALTSGRRSRIDDAPVRAGARTGSRSGGGETRAAGEARVARGARGTRSTRNSRTGRDRRDVGNRTRNAPTSQRRYHRS